MPKEKWSVYEYFLLKLKLMKSQTLTMKTMDLRMYQKRLFSDHESFCEHDRESEEDGDSGNEDVNNLELFSSKEDIEWRKTKFRQNIRCHNIVSRLLGKKRPAKDVTRPVKSWDLFINDNMIHLIVE
ncbi:hypothetical protein AVEN_73588-1 [Araneus ventricosus]|uniref:PiggyBac transposable element-derived protein domain-containing protein n=1 Tax=Araneus ventricosus TaxID=182803 RepID=A0A4Y2GJ47_ARAVE|nr:hypothetical protein AVEN_55223-1 [Araneus ventricosus]GBM53877.1 hypothetical protein AVEN_73588-1 [Araneus ventricosus]